MKKNIFYLLITVLSLSSCAEGNDKVIALSKAFFTTLSDSTYACPRDYYPLYDSLDVKAKSDFVEINEEDIVKSGDSWHVRCYNSYTSSKGVFKQDSVTLYIKTNSADQLYIYDSKGLVTIEEDLVDYGKSVGAFTNQSFGDIELARRIKHVTKMLVKEYWNVYFDLVLNVTIKDWSWETSYSGEAHGEGCVVNELDYIVDGIKYELTYYDRRGDLWLRTMAAYPKNFILEKNITLLFGVQMREIPKVLK